MTHKIKRCLLTLMVMALLLPGGAYAASAYAINMDNVLYRYQKGQTALEVIEPIAPIPRQCVMGLAKIAGGVYTLPYESNTLELVFKESGSPQERIPLPLSRDIKGAGKHSYLRHFVCQDGLLYFLISVSSTSSAGVLGSGRLSRDKARLTWRCQALLCKSLHTLMAMRDSQVKGSASPRKV